MIINAENINLNQFEKLVSRTLTNLDDNQITKIGELAFVSYQSLTAVSFPKCSTIENWAFYKCPSLTSVYLLSNTVVTLGGSEVFNSTPITATPPAGYVYVPASLLSQYKIAQYWSNISSRIRPYFQVEDFTTTELTQFVSSSYYQNNLTITDYYNSICTSIYNNAFEDCFNLSIISCPACTNIYSGAFYGCSNLTSVYFPNCKRIEEVAFYDCKNLTEIELNCSYIGYWAFNSCTHLTSVYLTSTNIVSIAATTFNNSPIHTNTVVGYYGSIYVPSGLLSEYKTARYWSDIADRITKL